MVVISEGGTLITLFSQILTVLFLAVFRQAGILFTSLIHLVQTRSTVSGCGPVSFESIFVHYVDKSFSVKTESTETFVRRMFQ